MDKPSTEFQKFDDAMRTIFSVSHDEFKRREAEWKKQRKVKRRKRPQAKGV